MISTLPEDVVICRYLRARLEANHDLRFAPEKVAEMFSYEMRKPEFETFGFHGLSHLPELWLERLGNYLNICNLNQSPSFSVLLARLVRNCQLMEERFSINIVLGIKLKCSTMRSLMQKDSQDQSKYCEFISQKIHSVFV